MEVLDYFEQQDSAVGQFEVDDISVKEVTRDNVPRIDYTGGGCPHILAEPQRTNLLTYSEDFSQFCLESSTRYYFNCQFYYKSLMEKVMVLKL